MRYSFTAPFQKQFRFLPPETQTKFWKQLRFLLRDIRHPSLRAKRYDETREIWQARVDRNYRFYFLIEKDVYVLLDIRVHP
ncbi:MAG: hypothetical protein Q8P39_02050 [Candidatus Yanofskybacteria bacterium]|nr:hypothetical protein [Candidatus Yanofskybacteria bacterium]